VVERISGRLYPHIKFSLPGTEVLGPYHLLRHCWLACDLHWLIHGNSR